MVCLIFLTTVQSTSLGASLKSSPKLLRKERKKVVGSIISKEQYAYVSGRNILDGPMIINKTITWAKKRKKKMFIFKVDFDKAFDSFSWNFLENMMSLMGFRDKWINWTVATIKSSNIDVLVNGNPTKQFTAEKDVHQGDHLSSFLFIIVTEGLKLVMDEVVEKGVFKGINLHKNDPTLFLSMPMMLYSCWSGLKRMLIKILFGF